MRFHILRDATATSPNISGRLVTWARRSSSIAVWVGIAIAALSHEITLSSLLSAVTPLGQKVGLAPARALGLVAVLWYAYLSQLKIRWVLWLPVYLVTYTPYVVVVTFISFLWSLGARVLKTSTETTSAPSAKRRRLPLKQLWVFFFVIWIVFFSGAAAPFSRWILVALLVPLWLRLLRFAYANTLQPSTFAEGLLQLANAANDKCSAEIREAAGKSKTDTPLATLLCSFSDWVIRRYQRDHAVSVIQRETLLSFSFFFVLAFGSSCILWAAVAHALIGNEPSYFSGYSFFTTGSFAECLTWAFGCMTTTIDYPGAAASLRIKFIHAAVLLMGLFHLSYLLMGFGVMASAETQRAAGRCADEYEKVITSRRTVDIELAALRAPNATVEVVAEDRPSTDKLPAP